MEKTMSKEKQPMQEGLFSAAKQFTDAFFDGLKTNAINRALDQAKNNKMPDDVIDSMEKIEKETQRLKNLVKSYQRKVQ
jgi:hypothetical protein